MLDTLRLASSFLWAGSLFLFGFATPGTVSPRPVPASRPAPPKGGPPDARTGASPGPSAVGPRTLATLELGGAPGAAPVAVAKDRVFIALSDGRVRGYRAERPAFWLKPPSAARSLSASADGRFLLVTSTRGTNWVYDLSGQEPVQFRRWERKVGLTEGLTGDGRLLVRGDVRGQVRGYELEGYKLKWLFKAESVAMSPDGKWALCRRGQALAVLDAVGGRPQGAVRSAANPVVAMAVASADRLAWVEQRAAGCALLLGGPQATPAPAPWPVPCHPQASLVFSPSGGLLVLAAGSEVQVRDGRTGQVRARHQRPGGTLQAAPLDDSSYVVVGLAEGKVTWLRLSAGPP